MSYTSGEIVPLKQIRTVVGDFKDFPLRISCDNRPATVAQSVSVPLQSSLLLPSFSQVQFSPIWFGLTQSSPLGESAGSLLFSLPLLHQTVSQTLQ